MSTKKRIHRNIVKRSIIGVVVFAFICLTAWWFGQADDAKLHWFSIVPPLAAIVLAFVTQKIHISLLTATIIGGVLATSSTKYFSISAFLEGIINGCRYIMISVFDPSTDSFSGQINLQILLFVVLVMAMISVLLKSGGLRAIIIWLERFARGKKSAQLITAIMGLAIFIDDYANTMLVGSSMRPVTDRHNISREKLAFLVDATSAPIAGLAIVSTWIGYEVGLFNDVAVSLGIGRDGYSLFFDAIQFRFYCILMIFFVFVNIFTGTDFGSMLTAERNRRMSDAEHQGLNPNPNMNQEQLEQGIKPRIITAILPLISLFLFLLGGLWFDGGGRRELSRSVFSVFQFQVWRDILANSQNNILLLMLAAMIGLFVAVFCAFIFSGISLTLVGKALIDGLKGSFLPISILILAWSLKGSCDALKTGEFIAVAVGNVISPLFFPSLLFIIAGLTSFATGTSWGTMAILIPTAVPLAFTLDGNSYGLVTMICLGAVLDGAIFGDHCSPISDTTIMSSIFSSCDHMQHVRTQLPYSLVVASLAVTCGYLPVSLGLSSWSSILIAVVIMICIFMSMRWFRKKKIAVHS